MSSPAPRRWVVDTNVLLRALANRKSKSAQIIAACERREAVIVLSRPVIDEYRRVLIAVGIQYKGITGQAIEVILRRLRYVGDYHATVAKRFNYPRDPSDSKWIELALAADASHIVTYDPDLLSLPHSRTDAGKRFRQRLRQVEIVMPDALVD